jgi:uncharacterized membrane protein YeaQ/YmgE (transglycosylase-associated protein family)
MNVKGRPAAQPLDRQAFSTRIASAGAFLRGLSNEHHRSTRDRRDCGLACQPYRSRRRLRLIGNIVIGILGALVASWVLPQLGVVLASGTLGAILNATIGGVIILVILSLVRRA